MKTELKKSYKGFVFLMLGFFAALILIFSLPISDEKLAVRIVLNASSWYVILMTYVIYKTEYVYWYSGTTYKEAVNAGSERRKAFAQKHFYRFLKPGLVFLAMSILFQILNISAFIDALVFIIGMIVVAFSTMKFKL